MKIKPGTRDRLRRLHPEGTLDDAVNAVCDEVDSGNFWDEMQTAQAAHDEWEAGLDDAGKAELVAERQRLDAFDEAAWKL